MCGFDSLSYRLRLRPTSRPRKRIVRGSNHAATMPDPGARRRNKKLVNTSRLDSRAWKTLEIVLLFASSTSFVVAAFLDWTSTTRQTAFWDDRAKTFIRGVSPAVVENGFAYGVRGGLTSVALGAGLAFCAACIALRPNFRVVIAIHKFLWAVALGSFVVGSVSSFVIYHQIRDRNLCCGGPSSSVEFGPTLVRIGLFGCFILLLVTLRGPISRKLHRAPVRT